MRIGINGLLLSTGATYRRTGVHRYVESLLYHLAGEARNDDLVAYVDRSVRGLPAGFHARPASVSIASPAVRIAWELAALPILVRRDRLDLFHGPVNVLPVALPCPSVVTVHDLAFLRYPEQVTARRYHYLKRLTAFSVQRAAAVIVPSVATGRDAEVLLHADPGKIRVVPLGVGPRFRPASSDEIERVRARYGLTRPFVLAVGTLEPRKNLPRLIAAMTMIRDEVREDLVLAGPAGWLPDEVERAITTSRLGERIKRPGYIEDADLSALYSAASVVAMPSLYEGFGLPVLEAMATGAVVVTSNCSSLPEVAGDAAILVDPLSVEAIASGIRKAITDTALRTRLRSASVEQAAQFTWARTARETMAIYRSVAG